jgi:hypothetical protein
LYVLVREGKGRWEEGRGCEEGTVWEGARKNGCAGGREKGKRGERESEVG